MSSDNDANARDDDANEEQIEREEQADLVADPPSEDDPAGGQSPATEQVHYEHRREQQKIDDFNKDRDPLHRGPESGGAD